MHHHGNILVAIILTTSKGHNIIKQLYEDKYGKNTSADIAYNDLYDGLIKEDIIVKVEETDKEMLIPAKQRAKCELARIWRLPRGSHKPLTPTKFPVTFLLYKNLLNSI